LQRSEPMIFTGKRRQVRATRHSAAFPNLSLSCLFLNIQELEDENK
jgi:hypothetical protein